MDLELFNKELNDLASKHGMQVDVVTSGVPIDISGNKVDYINGVAVCSVQAEFKPKIKSNNQ